MDSWHSYPKIYTIGHAALADLFLDPVQIEEKVDGSQFSFGRFDGQLKVRSRGQEIRPEAPPKLFERAVEVAAELPLIDGWTYRAEYLQKRKHNALCYSRIPERHLILFDINFGNEAYLCYGDKQTEAQRLGLDVVPLVYEGLVDSPDLLRELLHRESALGGVTIEGIVAKNYSRFGRDGKALMGKHVSEAFKEVHAASWKKANPNGGDIVQHLMTMFRSEARWEKAIQHLRERGELQNAPQDIGPLMKEIGQDLHAEEQEEIATLLWKWAWPHIARAATRGFPQWYKERLLTQQFEPTPDVETEGDVHVSEEAC